MSRIASLNLSKKGAVVALLLLILAVVMLNFTTKTPSPEQDGGDRTVANTGSGRVFVKDLHKLDSQINPMTIEDIETKLFEHTGRMNPGMYVGTIREGSYDKVNQNNGSTTYNFIVDTEPGLISYKVTLFGLRPSGVVRVVCAPESEQLKPGSKCEGAFHP